MSDVSDDGTSLFFPGFLFQKKQGSNTPSKQSQAGLIRMRLVVVWKFSDCQARPLFLQCSNCKPVLHCGITQLVSAFDLFVAHHKTSLHNVFCQHVDVWKLLAGHSDLKSVKLLTSCNLPGSICFWRYYNTQDCPLCMWGLSCKPD